LGLIPMTGSVSGLALVASLIGFGNGLGSGTMLTLGADLAPKESRGEFLGMWRLIGDFGHSTGPLLVGAVAGVLALPPASLVIGVGGIVASLIFAFLVPETARRTSK
jgi:MFS-type transporter involved in bile tolerance (Atg22 family)